jgi:hypothetical protein
LEYLIPFYIQDDTVFVEAPPCGRPKAGNHGGVPLHQMSYWSQNRIDVRLTGPTDGFGEFARCRSVLL